MFFVMEMILVIIIWAIYDWFKRNFPSAEQQKKIMAMKPLVDKERQLREDLFSGKIFKK